MKNNDYYDFDGFETYGKLNQGFCAFSCFILAFRVYSLISWIQSFIIFRNFANALFKTMTGLLFYSFLCFFIVCSWSFSYFVLLGNYNSKFSTISNSFLNFLLFNFKDYSKDYENMNSLENYDYHYFSIPILKILR